MDAEPEIKKSQREWARSKGISVDRGGYVRQVEANLFRPLSKRARMAFDAGAGSEQRAHMRALHSSSALVVNFFDYWIDRNATPILFALGIEHHQGVSIDLEAQFPKRLGGTPPHLDVAITQECRYVVAIESKFTEQQKRTTRGKSKFSGSYFQGLEGLWAGKGLPAFHFWPNRSRL